MTSIGKQAFSSKDILSQLQDMQAQLKHGPTNKPAESGNGQSFLDHLQDGVKEVAEMQKSSDQMAMNLASGKTDNIHETMLASTQAELSFNLMVQVRNKVLEAYQEVMRMQV